MPRLLLFYWSECFGNTNRKRSDFWLVLGNECTDRARPGSLVGQICHHDGAGGGGGGDCRPGHTPQVGHA